MSERENPVGKRVEIVQKGHPWRGHVGRVIQWSVQMDMYEVQLEGNYLPSCGVDIDGMRLMEVQD